MNLLGMVAGALPVLDPWRCNLCGWCIAICPTECLQISRLGPWLARPLDCLACAACAQVCPEKALHMDEFTVEDPPPSDSQTSQEHPDPIAH